MEVKALFGNLREGAEAEYAGVVDQNIQSPERGIHFFEQPRDICGVGHVGPDRDRLAPTANDCPSDPFGASPVGGIVQGDARESRRLCLWTPR